LDAAQEVLVPKRLPLVREGDDDAQPGTDEGAQLVLRLGQPAGGDRGALGLERERLTARERIELGGAGERLRLELFLLPETAACIPLPHEVGWAVPGGNKNCVN